SNCDELPGMNSLSASVCTSISTAEQENPCRFLVSGLGDSHGKLLVVDEEQVIGQSEEQARSLLREFRAELVSIYRRRDGFRRLAFRQREGQRSQAQLAPVDGQRRGLLLSGSLLLEGSPAFCRREGRAKVFWRELGRESKMAFRAMILMTAGG